MYPTSSWVAKSRVINEADENQVAHPDHIYRECGEFENRRELRFQDSVFKRAFFNILKLKQVNSKMLLRLNAVEPNGPNNMKLVDVTIDNGKKVGYPDGTQLHTYVSASDIAAIIPQSMNACLIRLRFNSQAVIVYNTADEVSEMANVAIAKQ